VSWLDVGPLDRLPLRGARVVRVGGVDIAVFRTGEGRVFALRDQCPHRGGPLSQGIVHGERVTCPLHEWVIDLRSGNAVGADTGCTPAFATRVVGGRVAIDVPPGTGGASAEAPACSAVSTEALRRADASAEALSADDPAFDPRVGAVFERA
jgi:nitrite reductase (NADH) small subunit